MSLILQLANAIITVISSVMASIAANFLYDLIKETLTRKGVTKRTDIVEVTQPDGTRIVVVNIMRSVSCRAFFPRGILGVG